jgi:hypothetical protein
LNRLRFEETGDRRQETARPPNDDGNFVLVSC